MLNRILSFIAGDYNTKEIKKLQPTIHKIRSLVGDYEGFGMEQVQNTTALLKERVANGESLDDILPEAFANVIAACKAMQGMEVEVKGAKLLWNMVPFDSQLIGGIVLHQGKIAEMKTGEGKTLVATLPAYLNALEGKGVHVVTVNDYLASRDSEWMAYLYNFLGLSVGAVTKEVQIHMRREEYAKDITYVENSELGFDYLRDNLAKSLAQRNVTRRPLHYAIVDEVDSICIDEARTPLIISEPRNEDVGKYEFYAQLVNQLKPCSTKKKVSKGFLKEMLSDEKSESTDVDGDYYIDEKTKTASLTSEGIAKLERIMNVQNLYSDLGYHEIHHIENALKANAVFHIDKDYLIANGEVLIVDEHTGRAMPGRRYSEGLHQAIEAKENVQIQKESRTLATITYQNFFKIYKKLSGMTGTATTEGEEFEKIYSLGVIAIPTNRNVIRVDNGDRVYFNQEAKRKAVTNEISFYHAMGLPILIGTSSIATSEYVSGILSKTNIPHYVLNAKYHEQEAKIVSNAGKLGSIVVATNMAGRGTDIKLESGLNEEVAKNYSKRVEKQIKGDTFTNRSPEGVQAFLYSQQEFELTIEALKNHFGATDEDVRQSEKDRKHWGELISVKIVFSKRKKQPTDVFAEIYIKAQGEHHPQLGQKEFHYGLYILGTEKHDSRRIDNQLRGRAGRQGDPGISSFFVALDDEIMRKMGGERIQGLAKMFLSKQEIDSLELTQKQFTGAITRAQKQMEGWHFGIRKHLFEYDSVINKQRQRIYTKRDEILLAAESEDSEVKEKFLNLIIQDVEKSIGDVIRELMDNYSTLDWSQEQLKDELHKEFGILMSVEEIDAFPSLESLQETISKRILDYFRAQIETIDRSKLAEFFKAVHLHVIDTTWIEHIDDMQYLRDKVGLYGYAQVDPLIIYKKEAFEKFEALLSSIKKQTVGYIIKTDFTSLQQNVPVIQFVDEEVKLDTILSNVSDKLGDLGAFEIPKSESRLNDDGVEVFSVDSTKSNPRGPKVVMEPKKLRPNDLCWCGSGKKYKKCHGLNG